MDENINAWASSLAKLNPYLKVELQQNMHYTSNSPSTKLDPETSADKAPIEKLLLELIWFCMFITWRDRKKIVNGFSLEVAISYKLLYLAW